jgi:hypothetical protein
MIAEYQSTPRSAWRYRKDALIPQARSYSQMYGGPLMHRCSGGRDAKHRNVRCCKPHPVFRDPELPITTAWHEIGTWPSLDVKRARRERDQRPSRRRAGKLGLRAADRAIEVIESAGVAPEGADYWRGS